jgi:hypothetical protein
VSESGSNSLDDIKDFEKPAVQPAVFFALASSDCRNKANAHSHETAAFEEASSEGKKR